MNARNEIKASFERTYLLYYHVEQRCRSAERKMYEMETL